MATSKGKKKTESKKEKEPKVLESTVNTEERVEVANEPELANDVVTVKKTYRVKKNLEPNMIVTVKNGFQGSLTFISPRTKERFFWECFGAEQDIDLQELKNARNASKKFFENNWFLIDDPEVLEYLGVAHFYKNALTYEDFDEIFELSAEEIAQRLSLLSKGQKKSVAYRAKQLIADDAIDSIKVINALEESLGIELIEK